MNEYVVAADAGKKRDRDVFMVAKRGLQIVDGSPALGTPGRKIDLMTIVRIDQFGFLPYPEFVRHAGILMGHRDLTHNADLLVDGNGVGEAVVDMMREAHMAPISIIATGGQHVKEVYVPMGAMLSAPATRLRGAQGISEIDVPRPELVRTGMIALQQGRVGIAKGTQWQEEFRKQLMAFRGEMDLQGRVGKREPEDERVHDDIVFCYLMLAWWCAYQKESGIILEEGTIGTQGETLEWDPMEEM